jgi:hypothetical protein
MAGLSYTVTATSEMSLTAGVDASPIYIATPDGNTRFKIKGFSISFKGVDPLASPVLVTLARCTAGSGTYSNTIAASSIANNGAGPELSRAIVKTVAAATPATKGLILSSKEVHPQGGYETIKPLGDEWVVAGSGAVALYSNPPAGVSCTYDLTWEE